MAIKMIHSRGLTLIEVLLALVLLAAIATLGVGIFRDASAATKETSRNSVIDGLAHQADLLIDEHGETLGKLAAGQAWRPSPEAGDISVVVTREPCEDCPPGWARLSLSSDEISLTRFHRVDPRTEQAE